MKATCYLRIAKTDYNKVRFDATTRQSDTPLTDVRGRPLPTVCVKLNLDLPPQTFGPDAEVDVAVPAGAIEVLAEVEE